MNQQTWTNCCVRIELHENTKFVHFKYNLVLRMLTLTVLSGCISLVRWISSWRDQQGDGNHQPASGGKNVVGEMSIISSMFLCGSCINSCYQCELEIEDKVSVGSVWADWPSVWQGSVELLGQFKEFMVTYNKVYSSQEGKGLNVPNTLYDCMKHCNSLFTVTAIGLHA